MADNLKIAPEQSSEPEAATTLAPVVQMPAAQKPKPESDFPFSVMVGNIYEGPLDLLLHLIRKQDIDIYDIPIGKITAQYLAYVEKLRELDVNVAAEFIYMAAVLIHIKSKMLLPRDPDALAGSEEDPRTELVNRLIEHEKFKSAAQMLLQKQMIDYLRRRLALEDRPLRLKQILRNVNSHQALVCMFLALLEMVRLQAIQLRQGRIFGEILLRKHSGFDAIVAEQAAVRDDWR